MIKNIIGFAAILFIASIFALLGVLGTISWYNAKLTVEQPVGYSEAKIVNVIGTAAVPILLGDTTVTTRSTTTEAIYIGNDVNVVDFNIRIPAASSSPAHVGLIMVEQSNDVSCVDNASTINWTNAIPLTSTIQTATSTYPFTQIGGHGYTYRITNWNALCARVTVGMSSSTVWVSASKQSLNAN